MADKKHEKRAGVTAPKSLLGDATSIVLALVVVALIAYIVYNNSSPWSSGTHINGTNSTNNSTNNGSQTAKNASVTLELFVMSHCPYGVQAEVAVKSVIDKFGGDVALNLHFIANDNGDGTFSSLHGAGEVAEDLRQVCIMKYYPQSLLNYLSCISPSYTNSNQTWSGCATQGGIDTSKISQCSTGSEGVTLLRSNIQRTNTLTVQSSPTIYLNGQQYNGAASEGSLTSGICAVAPGSSTCKNLPPEVSVGLTVVNDKNCMLCDSSQIVSALKSNFGMNNLTVRTVDYTSDEGKALMQQFNITGVPTYIMNASIAKHSSYSSLSRYLQPVGSSYLLLVQPVELVNVKEENNTIKLFVMSWCPYGNMAEVAMKELLGALPDLKFTGLYFIANDNGDGTFSSLHGAGEVAEDLRQVCIMKYYNNSKLFDYMMCIDTNSSNSANIWQKCASDNGIDATKMGNCSTGTEGKALLDDNIKLANTQGIQSSPTLILNNNTIFNSVSAEQMKQVVCGYSPALTGCNKTLSGQTSTPSAGCG